MTRTLPVYALYNRKRWIGLLLLSTFTIENIVQATSMIYVIPTLPFHPVCLVISIPRPTIFFGYVYSTYDPLIYINLIAFIPRFATVFTQLLILGLTVGKHHLALRAGWRRTPIVSLMLRDGATVFFVVAGQLLSLRWFFPAGSLTQI